MPFISFTTNKTLTLSQEKKLKEQLGELITLLPNKTEENLMLHFEDRQIMYFRGKDTDCMKIECQLFHEADLESKQKFVKAVMKEVENITKIPVKDQYLTVVEYQHWGRDGELK